MKLHQKIKAPRSKAAIPAALLAAAVVLSGCTTGGGADAASATGSADGQAAGNEEVRSVFNADPRSFDPVAGGVVDDYAAHKLMYATLVYRDKDNKVAPGLASEWKVTPTRATFTIRKGATCGDGTEITPKIVADSLAVFADPDSGSNFRELVFGPGQAKVSADAAAGTVTVDLAQPWSDLLNGMMLSASGIVCPAGLKDRKALALGEVPEAVSGPYELTEKRHGVSYEFTLREGAEFLAQYAEQMPGHAPKKISYSINTNSSAVSNELLTGTMDLAVLRGKDMTRFEGNQDFRTERIPSGSMFVLFNEREGHPFADEAKRRAVAQVIDQQAFNQAASGGLGEVYTSFAMPGVQCSNKDPKVLIPMDKQAAGQELKGLKVRFIGSQAFGPNGAANTYLAEALREAGAEVDLQNVDNATWSSELTQKVDTWDISIMASINAGGTMYGAMSTFVGLPTEDGGMNWGGYTNEPALDVVKRAMAQTDEAQRCQTYQDAQELLIGQAHVIPLSSLVSQVTARNGVWQTSPDGFRSDETVRIGG